MITVKGLISSSQKVLSSRPFRFLVNRLSPKEVILALDDLAGVREDVPAKVRLLSFTLEKLTRMLTDKMGASLGDVQEFLKDPYNRRGLASIIKGIAAYGVTRPQKLYAPFMVVWDFTKQCNLKCMHCYANASFLSAPDELTLDQKVEVFRQLDEAGVAAISFSGGEPLMNRDFWVLAKMASRAGMYVSVATNGTLIKDKVAKRLKETGVRYVEVSLDSVNPEVHDHFRGVPGAWERAVKGIRNAKRAGLEVGIAMTVTKMNYKELPEMIELAKKLKVDRLIAFNFVPTGRGKEAEELDLSPEEREFVLKLLYEELSGGELQAFSTSPFYSVVSLKGGEGQPNAFRRPEPANGGRLTSSRVLRWMRGWKALLLN